MSAELISEIADAISVASGNYFQVSTHVGAVGGCINQSLVFTGVDGRRYFVKLNRAADLAMFEAEAAGLLELRDAGAIRVPDPLTSGVAGEKCFLVMEWLDLRPAGKPGKFATELGEQLALLHRTTWHAFGWDRANTIGSTPQSNLPADSWVQFYRDQRLKPQLELAAAHGAAISLIERGERLLASIGNFFPGYTPQPSLLHGDLWSGNTGICAGEPVVFDPAVYFGDRETDIAMSELFGGFDSAFYAAYNGAWPLDQGYSSRKLLYQLYHLLNHFNLFGGAYARQSSMVIDRLLAELR